jgi:hypothetical protein
MHADICDPDDEAAVERFRATLKSLGATLKKKDWAIGVDTCDLQIGAQSITVFSDAWSIDIKGPDDLVQRIVNEFKRSQPLTQNK